MKAAIEKLKEALALLEGDNMFSMRGPPNPKPKPKPRPKHLKADAIAKLCEAAEAAMHCMVNRAQFMKMDAESPNTRFDDYYLRAAQQLLDNANALREAVKEVRGD